MADGDVSKAFKSLADKTAGWQRVLPYLLPIGCYVFVWLLFGVRYEVNDDATLSNIAAGAYGADSQYLIYINVLVGYLLKPLYFILPNLNWLYVLQTVTAVAGLGILCKTILHQFGMCRGAFFAVLLLLLAGIDLFQSFQYVKNSGLYLIVGFVLFEQGMGQWNRKTWAGIIWVLFGSMIRFQNVFAVAGIAFGFLLCRFVRLSATEKRRAVLAVLILVGLVAVAKGIDWMAYQSVPEWKAFVEYNAVRTEISDFRLQYANADFLQQFGYSTNDFDTLDSWNYWDDDVFPLEKLQQIAAQLPYIGLSDALRQTIGNLLSAIGTAPIRLLFSVVCLAGVFFAQKRKSLFALLCLVMTGLMIAYLSFVGRYPYRVEYVLLLSAAVFVFLSCQWQEEFLLIPLRNHFFFGVFVLMFLCVPVWMQLRSNMQLYRFDRSNYGYYEEYAADKQNLYVADIMALDSLSGYDVLHPRPKDFFSNIVFMGGWLSNSPFQREVLARYNIQNIYSDMLDRQDVFLIDYYNVNMKEIYWSEHEGKEVTRITVRETPTFWLYQFTTK